MDINALPYLAQLSENDCTFPFQQGESWSIKLRCGSGHQELELEQEDVRVA